MANSLGKTQLLDKVLIVIPAYNEAANLGTVLDEVQQSASCDVVVVDDASSDKTRDIALDHGAMVLPLLVRLGAWGAAQTGIRYGLLQGYETVVTMDADGQHHPGDIPMLVTTLEQKKADVVIGSCPIRGSMARHTAWWLFRMLSGVKLEDLTSGLKVFSKEAMCHLVKADATIFDYQDLGVILFLLQFKMRVVECEVTMSRRADGKSRIFYSWLIVFKYMLQTLILCLSMRKFTKAPTVEEGN